MQSDHSSPLSQKGPSFQREMASSSPRLSALFLVTSPQRSGSPHTSQPFQHRALRVTAASSGTAAAEPRETGTQRWLSVCGNKVLLCKCDRMHRPWPFYKANIYSYLFVFVQSLLFSCVCFPLASICLFCVPRTVNMGKRETFPGQWRVQLPDSEPSARALDDGRP